MKQSKCCVIALGIMPIMLVSGCDRHDPISLQAPTPRFSSQFAPVTDDVMGDLSPIAQSIIGALQDSAVRFRLAAALKKGGFAESMVDLQDCAGGPGSLVSDLLSAGERRHLGSAVALCEQMRSRIGVTLYMSPNRALAWNPEMIPIVTAIESPTARRPGNFLGYLSPTKTIELPDDGRIGGPILVVLGFPHPNRLRSLKPTLFSGDVKTANPSGGIK